jgi:phosphate starvation-inducible membrane PsiE
MPRIVRLLFAEDDQEEADRQTTSLAGLAVALLLVVIGLFLVRTLQVKSVIEDCLLSGRSNCDAVVVSLR